MIKVEIIKKILAVGLLAGSILVLAVGLRGDSGNFAERDFMAYWSAGQLLVQRQNPYSDEDVLKLEKAQGYKEQVPNGVLNPPWAMFLVVPLGYVAAYPGALSWIVMIVACIMLSVRLLQKINNAQDSQDHLLAYAFAPVLACIMAGQMSGIVCLGLVLFLWWHKTRPFAAGLAASVLTIKPHLFFLFFLVLLLISIRKRDFRSIFGAAFGVALALAIPLAYDHQLLSEYLIRRKLTGIAGSFIPTMSFLLRIAVQRDAFWIQFLPLGIATLWAFWYFFRHKDDWDWNREGLLLLVISMWVAPYSTFLDELILLPAVVAAICFTGKEGNVRRGVLPSFFVLNGIAFALLFTQVPVMSGAYVWSTTAWLGWYLYAVQSGQRFVRA